MREVFEIDAFGARLCLRECARRMSTECGKGRSVVMLSSMAAVTWRPGRMRVVWRRQGRGGRYPGDRGSREVAKEGMCVNAVTPGVIDTDIQPPGRIERVRPMLPMGRPGQPDGWPKRFCSCSRTRRHTSTALTYAFRARAGAV